MQNSTVISRVNAGLSRCLSHHRRLCRGIVELDRLIYNDEFLKDPRTQWLLHQRRQREEKLIKHKVISLGHLLSGKSNLAVTRAFCQLLLSESPCGSHSPKARTQTGPLPAPTPLPSPERRPSFRISASLPRPERKASAKACCQSC
ncbi:uncharacterized protein LOC128265800 [Drosophila gunungcola]|uniref:Uncharacterized protein n=1 Tax=Drosophila gunungcola TaxID=103775 RepID=A0A9P9YB17_9MUSC|nr:uncharacterized protein LOC128265800 [Drosophila gunungcola]KAI8033254.1 hypothetical protein M5D96_013996 [Drosophila gunungcola]